MNLLSEMPPLLRVLKQGDWICRMEKGQTAPAMSQDIWPQSNPTEWHVFKSDMNELKS